MKITDFEQSTPAYKFEPPTALESKVDISILREELNQMAAKISTQTDVDYELTKSTGKCESVYKYQPPVIEENEEYKDLSVD